METTRQRRPAPAPHFTVGDGFRMGLGFFLFQVLAFVLLFGMLALLGIGAAAAGGP